MKKVYENIDYDYPQCGGITVREYRDKWCLTLDSNFSSSRTNVKITVPKREAPTLETLIQIYKTQAYVLDQFITHKGQIVQ